MILKWGPELPGDWKTLSPVCMRVCVHVCVHMRVSVLRRRVYVAAVPSLYSKTQNGARTLLLHKSGQPWP